MAPNARPASRACKRIAGIFSPPLSDRTHFPDNFDIIPPGILNDIAHFKNGLPS